MPKISRFKKRLSDRSGFAYYELQMTYDEGSKIGADEFDTPPPSDIPLGGEGDVSPGDARANYTSYGAVSDQTYTTQYVAAGDTINVGNVYDVAGEKYPCPIFYICGSNNNVQIGATPQVNAGQEGDKVTLYSVGSSVLLHDGNGLFLRKNYLMDSGAILDLVYYEETDIPDSYTKLLLHCDGINGATTFTDSSPSGHTVTAVDDAQIDTSESKFGGSSVLFDGTGDYLTVPDSADWDFGTGDFTIDLWAMFNVNNATQTFYSQYDDGNNLIIFYYNSTNRIYFTAYSSSVIAQYYFTWTPTTSIWYHIELARRGANLYLFINGDLRTWTSIATPIASNAMPNLGDVVIVGAYQSVTTGTPTNFFNGWIDEFRVSKGIARHTANFTIPLHPYSDGKGWNECSRSHVTKNIGEL